MELNPQDFIITRKRKKYKFALFFNSPLCFELEDWPRGRTIDVLEVGAGTGLFAVELAARFPDLQVVAIDVKADRLQKGARQAETKGSGNVAFLRARVDQLADIIPFKSVKKIWVTFPDPFPRERSAKHRLTHVHYLELYAKWLTMDGALYFKTDAHSLFDWSLEQLVVEGWTIEKLSFDLHASNLDESYKQQTTYEQRFTNEGLKICFVKASPSVV